MNLIETFINRKEIYKGKILNLYKDLFKLPNNSTTYREIVKQNSGCSVLAIKKNYEIIMVKQFRHAYRKVLAEIPAGIIDDSDPSPLEAAKRELLEETGYESDNWHYIEKFYHSPGSVQGTTYMFVALNAVKTHNQTLDDEENIEVQCLNFDDAVNMVMRGEIKDAKTIISILKLKILINEHKIKIIQ